MMIERLYTEEECHEMMERKKRKERQRMRGEECRKKREKDNNLCEEVILGALVAV